MSPKAPLILFVYDRPLHTRLCLEALIRNPEAQESDLYIYADGPRSDAGPEQMGRIHGVRDIIKKVSGFRKVYITESQQNKGLARSVMEGVSAVIADHEKVIVLEDDLVVSTTFLRYMNEGLNLYADDRRVFGCAGYAEPIADRADGEVFFSLKGTSWGWGTWNRVWNEFIQSWNQDRITGLSDIQRKEFNVGGYPFSEMAKPGKVESWSVFFYAFSFSHRGLWLTPTYSQVKNMGFDGSGTNCREEEMFRIPELREIGPMGRISVQEDIKAKKRLTDYYASQGSESWFRKINRWLQIRKSL